SVAPGNPIDGRRHYTMSTGKHLNTDRNVVSGMSSSPSPIPREIDRELRLPPRSSNVSWAIIVVESARTESTSSPSRYGCTNGNKFSLYRCHGGRNCAWDRDQITEPRQRASSTTRAGCYGDGRSNPSDDLGRLCGFD